MSGETSQEIDEQAALWAARLDRAPLTPDQEAELASWLNGDPRRLGAYAKARAVSLHSMRAAALGGVELDHLILRPAPRMDRRVLMAASVTGVIASAGLMAASWRHAQSYRTQKGEVRQVDLGDGSFMTLNTDSRASVRFGRSTREIVLTFGEALFSVAEGERPFVVRSAGSMITALAGQFVVRRLGRAPLEVLAIDRPVQMKTPDARSWAVMPLKVAALAQGGLKTKPVNEGQVERALAWREMQLAFENDRLDKAAAEFARYSDQKIHIANEAVAALRISGLFRADDPASFARAVAISLNLHASIGSQQINLGPRTI